MQGRNRDADVENRHVDTAGKGRVGRIGRSKREGTYVYIELIHFTVQQKLALHCKAVIRQ